MTEPTPYYITNLINETEQNEAKHRRSVGTNYAQIIAAFYLGLVAEGMPAAGALHLTAVYLQTAANTSNGK